MVFELISYGGQYAVHKIVQTDPPAHSFAGPWPHREARMWWMRIVAGQVR
ncbi:hypothetical protein ACIBG8_44415 [Nonomuraea sp. NPDC050556]